MIQLFTQMTYTKGLGCEPHDGDSQVPLLAWKSTAYTVHAIEFLLRDTEKPLLGALSSRQRDSLEGLARLSAVMSSTWSGEAAGTSGQLGTESIAEYALTCLCCLLRNPESEYSILGWDAFGMLVTLISSLSNLLSRRTDSPRSIITGSVAEQHALRLVFTALVVKVLLTSKFEEDESMEVDAFEEDDEKEEDEGREKPGPLLLLMKNLSVSSGRLSGREVRRRLEASCAPFLRCCVLYFHYVTDVPAPVELTERGGDSYANMCRYLGLPESCDELFTSERILRLSAEWASRARPAEREEGTREPLRINRLVELPEDYSELMNTVSMFICPNSDKEDSRNPTMCLICGDMLCSQSYCCQIELNKVMVGACTYHASHCGAGVGVFLRVRDCEIVLLRSPNRGSYGCPPYFDEYGETDQGLHRGNPLKLCKDKYKRLNQMWLGHGLYEAIARATDTSTNVTGQWQHL
jgi:E3 ubiquitin-protein ligase UBR2